MSAQSKSMVPALVSYGDWNSTSRSHPCSKWLENYTQVFDSCRLPEEAADWHDTTWTYCKADGTMYENQTGVDQVMKDYSYFTHWKHEPYYLVCYDAPDGTGYELTGNAWVFCNLPGNFTGPGVQDANGDKWQMKVPGGFFFKLKKDSSAKHGGIKIMSTSITADSSPVVFELLKRGVMKPSDLGL